MKVFTDGDWVTLSDQEIEYGAYAKLTMMDEKIKRVRELHKPFGENNEWCDHCEIGQNSGYEWADYPCPTIKALDGDV